MLIYVEGQQVIDMEVVIYDPFPKKESEKEEKQETIPNSPLPSGITVV